MALRIWLPLPQEKDEVLFRRVDVELVVEHGKDLGTMIRSMVDQMQQDLPSWIGVIYTAT